MEEHQECIYDSLTIYDGHSENSSTLGVFCGGKEPNKIIASRNHLFMVLRTDAGLQKKGFRLQYFTECGGYLQATNDTQYFFSHPGFRYVPYKSNIFCNWRIQAENSDSHVKIKFIFFEIEYSEKCVYDYVEIHDEITSIENSYHGKFCGNKVSFSLILSRLS